MPASVGTPLLAGTALLQAFHVRVWGLRCNHCKESEP
jgi:hypothetical protein